MEVKDIQQECFLVYDRREPKRNLYQRFFTLVEEVGELSEALLVADGCKPNKETNVGEEIADIFSNLMTLSTMLDIDVEKETLRKLEILSTRE
ncbi:hypothetical protein LCGC14_2608810 [marine sediment metagenome]|uniref:Uncharacterized protein n=1 Tax=marine sediment metagenome TaxID=412755 RepID=A0A0F9AU52_9ZZZZ